MIEYVLLGILGAISLVSVYVAFKTRQDLTDNFDQIQDFISPAPGGEDSPLIKFLGQVGISIAQEVTEGVNRQLTNSLGGTMKGATAELEQQAMAQDPSLAIMAGMPKSIKKNPLAYMAMQALLQRNMPSGIPLGANNPGDNGSQVKFDL